MSDEQAKAASAGKGKLTDERLVEILRKEESAAAQWQDSELSGLRQKALDYYDRQPLGDEEEGQSKIVTSEFADTIESIMPNMMRVFASGEDVVEFTPIEQADEQAATEASQYIPHVLMRENDGFVILHGFIKDALMSRLGGATVDVEEIEKAKTDPVERWADEQLAMAEQLATEAGATEVVIDVEQDEPPNPLMAAAGGEPPPIDQAGMPPQVTYSGTITVVRKRKRVTVDGIAPEDIMITPGTRKQSDASLQGFRKQVTSSDLRVLGLSQDDIDELSSDRPMTPEEDQRQDGQSVSGTGRKDDQRKLWLVVAFVKADSDGDGISETLRVVYAHAGGMAAKIIERTEWDEEEAPIAIATPILMPHTLVGRSLFDQVQDLQDIGTQLTRGMLDNLYLTNRPRPAINGRVNINSVIDWTPGMPIQVQGNENPSASIAWLEVPSIIGPALTGLDRFDSVRENRTGVSRYGQGLDANSLNQTASGITQIMSAAAQRQELMARVFAATGITKLMRHIYRAVKRAATGPIKYQANGEWAECDPTKWPDDMHLIVAVGTGTGNKEQQLQHLLMIGNAQERLAKSQGGAQLIRPEHGANTLRKIVEAAGFRATGQFVATPKEIAATAATPQQSPPSPEMVKVQTDAEAQKFKLQSDIALAREKAEADMQLQREQAQLDMQLAREKAALDAQLKREELGMEGRLRALEMAMHPSPAPNANIEEQQVTS